MLVFNNPSLLDYLMLADGMPDSERAQVEAMTGRAYDRDQVAAQSFLLDGPKWVFKATPDGPPICAGGYVLQRKGVWRDYMLTSEAAWTTHWWSVTRECRRIMDAMFKSGQAHRLECIALATRTEAFKWYKVLGLERGPVLHGYCGNGADAIMFAKVKH